MLSDELKAAGRVAADGFTGLVDRVEQTHRAVAARTFGAVGPLGAPVRLVHDAVSGVAYGSTRAIGSGTLRASGQVAARVLPAELPGAQQRTSSRVLKGALNGICGDRLAAQSSPLAIDMTAHLRGLPRAKVVVFIHGLCETEDAWHSQEQRRRPYGPRLRDELGYAPVYIRYNSGLGIDANGLRLATLLEQLVTVWPVPLSEITLVGHSMGGLLARAACVHADKSRWGALLRHVIALGVPHHGAPLEKTVAVACEVLGWAPETRAFSELLDARSIGIKDLRKRTTTPYTPDVSHHFYSAGLGAGAGMMETLLGDLLVARVSAWDTQRGEAVRFGAEHYRHLSGINHFDLLAHPAVADQLVRWLSVAQLTAAADAGQVTAAPVPLAD